MLIVPDDSSDVSFTAALLGARCCVNALCSSHHWQAGLEVRLAVPGACEHIPIVLCQATSVEMLCAEGPLGAWHVLSSLAGINPAGQDRWTHLPSTVTGHPGFIVYTW